MSKNRKNIVKRDKKGVNTSKKRGKKKKLNKKEEKMLLEIKKLVKNHPKIKKKIKNIKNIEKKLYYALVWVVTESQPLHILENSDKRGWKNYHLDHIYPISMCYIKNIPPEKAGNIKNLRFIHHEENLKKGAKITNESRNALRRINRLK
jgi:hypothetical protein